MSGFRNGNFVGLHRGEQADLLQRNHPAAFLLLCLIARRARYTEDPCQITGLRFGEAFIGDWKEAGLTSRKQYRCALDRLKALRLCDFRGAKTGANKGTVATLLPQGIFSIDRTGGAITGAKEGPRRGQQRAKEGPQTTKEPRNHETTRERKSAPAPEATGPGESGSAASLSLSDSGLSDCGDLREHLAKVFPNAPGIYSKPEKEALAGNRAILHEATPTDWDALHVWIIEADDKSRGCKLWPRNRLEFLKNAGEALEKVRTWWTDAGRGWWEQEEARRARRAAKAKEPPPEDEAEEPMSREEALAFLNAPLESQPAPQASTPPGSQKKTG